MKIADRGVRESILLLVTSLANVAAPVLVVPPTIDDIRLDQRN
jgi:hypothetical protein